ncbi:MAG: hypothetical protein AAF583_08620 [Pseudomonadota bacterium]
MKDVVSANEFLESYAFKLAEDQPLRNPWLGRSLSALFFLLAGALTVVIAIFIFASVDVMGGEIPSGVVRFVISLSVLLAMIPFYPAYHFGRKLSAKGALEILEKDARAPILYLRSFDDDRGGLKTWWLRGPLKLAGAIKSGSKTSTVSKKTLVGATSEDALVASFNKIGPVVAIGRPDETLPTLGAARIYMDESGWQDAVTGIAREAQYVVLGMGATGGLRWEYEFAFGSLAPQKIIIYLDAVKGSQRATRYTEFREFMESNFKIDLPREWHDAHAICFDSKWRPIFIRDQFLSITDLRPKALVLPLSDESSDESKWRKDMKALTTIALKAGAPICLVSPNSPPPDNALAWALADSLTAKSEVTKDWTPMTAAVFTAASTISELTRFESLALQSGEPRRWVCAINDQLIKTLRKSGYGRQIHELDRGRIFGTPKFIGFDAAGHRLALRTRWWPSVGWLGWVLPRAAALRTMGVSALQPFFLSIGRKTPGGGYRTASWILGFLILFFLTAFLSEEEAGATLSQDQHFNAETTANHYPFDAF